MKWKRSYVDAVTQKINRSVMVRMARTSSTKAFSQNLTPVTLELGGKSPLIIFEDADFEGAEAALLHITAGSDFALSNCHEIMAALRVDLARDVNLILGYRTDETLDSRVRVVMLVSAIPVNGGKLELDRPFDEHNNTASVLGDTIPMVG